MNARPILSAGALALAGCAAVAGIGDIELADPPPSTEASSTEPPPPAGDAPASIATSDGAAARAPEDAAAPADATVDAPLEAAADAASDAPVVVDPPDDVDPTPVTACVLADFQANDRRAPAADRTIVFPAVGGGYEPHCMMIRAGQSVTFEGDLAAYPLAPRGTSPAPNPIVPTSAGTTVTFTFPTRGRYRYGSPGIATMRGAIDVRP